jgi:hypothetical protein
MSISAWARTRTPSRSQSTSPPSALLNSSNSSILVVTTVLLLAWILRAFTSRMTRWSSYLPRHAAARLRRVPNRCLLLTLWPGLLHHYQGLYSARTTPARRVQAQIRQDADGSTDSSALARSDIGSAAMQQADVRPARRRVSEAKRLPHGQPA